MNRFIISSHGSFFDGFHESRMSMTSTSDIFSRSTILDGQDGFLDHLTSRTIQDVNTEDAIGFGISDELDQFFLGKVGVGSCSAVGHKREGTNTIFKTFLFALLFSQSNPSQFRICINNRWNSIIIHMTYIYFTKKKIKN